MIAPTQPKPNTPQPIWHGVYSVNTLVLNAHKRLGLHGLLCILQDVAWCHADELGCGFDSMQENGAFWVLTRQKVQMRHWPAWGDQLAIESWARPFAGALAPRDFIIRCNDAVIGEATTLWLTLDGTSHRPLRTPPAIACRPDGALTLEAAKITLQKDLPVLATLTVRNSDLDVNGHVNNTHYARWILDSLPAADLARLTAARYEVNFLAETGLGEQVEICGGPVSGDGADCWQFQGTRPDGKTLFAARLTTSPAAS